MFHMLAFSSLQTAGGTNDQLDAVADDYYNRANSSFQIPKPTKILGMGVMGATLTRSRINTASLRLRGFPQIIPIQVAATWPTDPNVMDVRDMPIDLAMEEDFRVDTSNTAGADEQHYAFALVTDKAYNRNINHRELRWIRFTAAVTAVANAWSGLAAITLEDTIEGGRYAIYGMFASTANGILARLQLQDQYERPGCQAQTAVGQRSHKMFDAGLGLWGYFNTYTLPQIQSLENGAGASTIEGRLLVAKAA